jgi:class 3 adenylate cyclase
VRRCRRWRSGSTTSAPCWTTSASRAGSPSSAICAGASCSSDDTGEVEYLGEGIGGIAVRIGARVVALASAGEVLVTRTVKDLTAGSGIAFEERETHRLRGVAGDWRLFGARDAGNGV